MHCPKCHSENGLQARFCNRCGTRLESACPGCGTGNTLGSRFCSQCGQGLSHEATTDALRFQPAVGQTDALSGSREERRWATMLFADLSNFTALSERLDPEDVKALAHACTDRLGQEVRRHGGTVITIAGDQV